VPELAWFGRARDPEAAIRHASQVWSALGSAAASGFASPAPEAVLSAAPAPVPGAKAFWLDTGWLEAMTKTTISADGDFKPSIALQGDVFVLSTSPKLGRSILSTTTKRLMPPQPAKPLVAWSSYPCLPIARAVAEGARAIDKLSGTTSFYEQFQANVSPVCDLVEGLSSTTEQDGDRLISRFRLPAKPGLYQGKR
jgi:hypothetical protein